MSKKFRNLNLEIGNFRRRYPRFIYEGYFYKILNNKLKINFKFKIEPDIYFSPEITIFNVDKKRIKSIKKAVLDNLVFNLGMMEIPSYWKATCSPEIIVKAGILNKEQIGWWKKIIMRGMGQFFYENKINFKKPDFLKIKTLNPSKFPHRHNIAMAMLCRWDEKLDSDGVLVPVGGGKDAVVTLETLKRAKFAWAHLHTPSRRRGLRYSYACFSLNPTTAARKIIKIAGCKKPIIVERKIDTKLLKLNRKGYLNGHTPFSAYLAFLSVLVAIIFDKKFIAFSNERSSNEGNVKYLGKMINHQWSKSFQFEQLFRQYSKKYLAREVEYFSFLRPLYELQIAKLFSKCPEYFSSFLSCNEAYKTYSGKRQPTGKWCGRCSKCLFVFSILYPFLTKKDLIKIFGENLFEKRELLPIMEELIGERKFKPFECVGTKKETLAALYLSLEIHGEPFSAKLYGGGRASAELPFLLEYFQRKILPKYPNLEADSKRIMNSWNNRHNLPSNLGKLLKSFLTGLALTTYQD